MARDSDFTETDESLLKARFLEYRSTPAPEKEAFRVACAKYILRARQLDDSDPIYVELFSSKVRNWFQNNTEKRPERLPTRIHQSFHPLRIFGHKNRDLIRDTLANENKGEEPDDRAYIVQWNETARRLWDELPEEEKQPYVHLAELWSVQGPDDELKPWMAEKRGPVWMRSVGNMFWTQCGMALFMYGMFKDSNGRLRATVYDTTELWAYAKPDTPLFRNVKGWDQDFRRKAWLFFQAILAPELATQDTLDVLQATRKHLTAPFVFDLYSDGTPILPDGKDNGKLLPTYRRQHILREYLRIHYGHAKGHEVRSVPWQSLQLHGEKFFAPGMLPEGLVLQDPSHVVDDELVTFFAHVARIESHPDAVFNRFRFSHYEEGPKDNRRYLPAVYSGSVAPLQARRAKKAVIVPEFDGPPSDGESEGPRTSQPPRAAAVGGAKRGQGSRIPAALHSDFERVRADLAAARPQVAATTPDPNPGVPAPSGGGGSKGKSAATAADPWIEGELDGSATAIDIWDDTDDEFLDGAWGPNVSTSNEAILRGDGTIGSDEEVEEALDVFLAASSPTTAQSNDTPSGTSSAVLTGLPPHRATAPDETGGLVRRLASPPSPHSIATTGSARFNYLQALATDPRYQRMLRSVEMKLRQVVVIRGKSPVMWVTWGHKMGHVPEAIHKSEANAKSLMKWIEKGVSPSSTAVEAQRFCLAVGLVLSDLQFVDVDTDGVDSWPEGLPGYLAYSHLADGYRDLLMEACTAATLGWAPEDDRSLNTDGEALRPTPPAAHEEPPALEASSPQEGTGDGQALAGTSARPEVPSASPDQAVEAQVKRGRGRRPAAVGRARKATREADAAAVGTVQEASASSGRITRARSRAQ